MQVAIKPQQTTFIQSNVNNQQQQQQQQQQIARQSTTPTISHVIVTTPANQEIVNSTSKPTNNVDDVQSVNKNESITSKTLHLNINESYI